MPKPTITWPATETITYFAVMREIVPDEGVVEQFAIVLQADEIGRRIGRGAEVGERIAERIDQRKDVEDDQEQDRRDDEQIADRDVAPCRAPPRASADQAWSSTAVAKASSLSGLRLKIRRAAKPPPPGRHASRLLARGRTS